MTLPEKNTQKIVIDNNHYR